MWMQAMGIPALVQVLKEGQNETAAELAAVALRNLARQNQTNKDAILAAGGFVPLLNLLSSGREVLLQPLQCEASLATLRVRPESAQLELPSSMHAMLFS